MDSTVSTLLAEVLACKIPKDASDQFVQLLDVISNTPGDDFVRYVSDIAIQVSQESISVMSSKKFCDELISCVSRQSNDLLAIVAFQAILNRMQSRNIAFESQIVDVRVHLSDRFRNTGRLRDAANMLSEIPLESGQRTYAAGFKMDIYLRVAEDYLKLRDIPEAEAYINRASLLQPECHVEKLLMRYKAAYARLLDHKRKFLEAGQRYAELSVRFPDLPEAERIEYLERALSAALLASAGQQRNRLLTNLFKDERCQGFESYPVLEKMCMGRLINRSSLTCLQSLFEKYYPHLLKSTQESSDPMTGGDAGAASTIAQSVQCLLERAVVEYNMLAASLIYNNISLVNLAGLLEISPSEAELIASHMISEDRLSGQIDQIDGVIYFNVSASGQDPILDSWSSQIRSLCTAVNDIMDDIEDSHPEWVHNQLASRMSVDAVL